MVNCLPPRNVGACLPALAGRAVPFGVYANLGAPDDASGFRRSDDCTPEVFADQALRWHGAGARILGGCCGTTPEHLRVIARRLSEV
jgi:homocysteine S-methyltransferase